MIPSGAPGKPDKMVSTLSSLIFGLSHRIARELTFSWRGLRNNIAFSERIIGLSRVLLLACVPYTSYSRAVKFGVFAILTCLFWYQVSPEA